MWEEVFRRFGKENSAINATDFYAGTLTRHPDGVTWGSFEIIIFASSSDLTSETLWIIIHQWTIQVSLKSRLSPKCARSVFLNQSWLTWNQGSISWVALKIKVVFKVRVNPSFLTTLSPPPPPILVEILCRQNPHVSTKRLLNFFGCV